MYAKLLAVLFLGAVAIARADDSELNTLSELVCDNLDGNPITFRNTPGRCVLIYNTASRSPDWKAQMKWLRSAKKDVPAVLFVAYPSNNFGNEPRSNGDLREWFDLVDSNWSSNMVKTDIKNDILFDFLAKRSGKAITGDWNKYLVWKDSKTVTHYGANEGPVQWGRIQYDLNNCNRS